MTGISTLASDSPASGDGAEKPTEDGASLLVGTTHTLHSSPQQCMSDHNRLLDVRGAIRRQWWWWGGGVGGLPPLL